MEIFIRVLYPDLTVVRVHSETNLFRYDENISFAKKELMPTIDSYRDAHARGMLYPDEEEGSGEGEGEGRIGGGTGARPFDPDWKQSFAVALSFADGAPARTHAIQASLRPYKPIYYHFWQLKTFWHDSKLCDEDIEVHPFEEMETAPAMDAATTTDDQVRMVVEEMKRFRHHFLETLDGKRNDIRDFWLRKTRKPVLAVLLVQDAKTGQHRMHRGANMEVSMPTGSLCAERNVIGTALASDPGLRREDLLCVAVLAVPLPKEDDQMKSLPQLPSPPPVLDPSMCIDIGRDPPSTLIDQETVTSSTRRTDSIDETKLAGSRQMDIPRSHSLASFSSVIEEGDYDVLAERDALNFRKDGASLLRRGEGIPMSVKVSKKAMQTPERKGLAGKARNDPIDDAMLPPAARAGSPAGNPLRKIRLNPAYRPMWGGGVSSRKKKRTVVLHSSQDINPLRPCGACNEWLKKIAESNPYFRVITFTDADCNGVYVTPCQD